MHEGEEQDTCRICSAPAEPDQPLFYPCKCSGTIRYIHQDCLTTWLAHSKKKTCDVCKHHYSFTKVYAPDMPSHIPPFLLIRRLVQQLLFGVLFVIRAIVVAIIWLAFLPWVTVWTWRMYFAMGESTAWWISNRPRPPPHNGTYFTLFPKLRYERFPLLSSPSSTPADHLFPQNVTLAERITSHPTWINISADIFTGQIIAALIVLTFVAIFLLREWISQNARPGLFEDDELPAEDPANIPIPLADQPFAPPRQDPPDIPGFPEEDLAQMQQQAVRVMDAFRLQANQPQDPHPDGPVEMEYEPGEVYYDAKGKQRDDGEPTKRPRVLKKLGEGEDEDNAGRLPRAEYRRMKVVRHIAARRRHLAGRQDTYPLPTDFVPEDREPQEEQPFKFTFKAAPLSSGLEGEAGFPKPTWHSNPSSPTGDGKGKGKAWGEPFFPTVQLQPPRDEIPFSIRSWKASPPSSDLASPASPNLSAVATAGLASPTVLSLTPSVPSAPTSPALPSYQRPPLPSSIFSSPTTSTSEYDLISPWTFSLGSQGSDVALPSPSPPLATYQPPEEMGGDEWLSNFKSSPDYFVRDEPSTSTSAASSSASEADTSPPPSLAASRSWMPPPLPWATTRDVNGFARSVDDNTLPPHATETQPKNCEHGLEYITDSDGTETEGEDDEAPLLRRPIGGYNPEGMGRRRRAYGVVHDEREEDHEEDEDDEEEEEDEAGRYFRDPDDHDDDLDLGVNQQFGPFLPQQGPAMQEGDLNNNGDGGEGVANDQGGNGQGQDGNNPGLDANDDLDGNVEDDMEGAMEAIGMRGPIYGVLQNAALMVFVLDTAIGLCIWIPFTVGKTTALLSLDPARMLQIMHLPIKAMRLVTDPIVDSAAYIIMRFFVPPILTVVCTAASVVGMIASIFFSGPADKVSQGPSSNLFDQSMNLLNTTLSKLPYLSYLSTHHFQTSSSTPSPDHDHLFPPFARPLEPYFEVFGRQVRTSVMQFQDSWIRLALGSEPVEKVFATMLGYAVFGLCLAVYLNLLTVGNARTAGRAVRNAVRQQLLVLKVAAFIVIELVCFPLACGVVLDVSTVWLFPEASLQSRYAFFGQAPLTAMFSHWLAGTMFMYSFAVLLSGCRNVMRAGAMWFIKDPQDQNAHPIRDILERPTVQQLKKISVSAVMYSMVVLCVVGSVAGLLLLGSKSIMPFRWKNREPLSHVPLDLLFLHLVLPQTLHYFRPRRGLKSLATKVWRFLAGQLRLTSYFFGGRYPLEEYGAPTWTAKLPWYQAVDEDEKGERQIDGTFRRVPATDNLALPRDMKATVQVHANGMPVDDASANLMRLQNAEAHKAKHDIEKDYTIVFIPTGFKYRVISFILLLWIVGALFLGVAVALPVQLGRSFFTVFTSREVHDGYSFIVGFYSLWACYLCAKAIDKLGKEQQRIRETQADGEPRRDVRIMAIKRCLFWISKMAYAGLFLGIVIPVLFAFVMDLYVVLPIRTAFSPGVVPRIKVVDSWALGLMYAKIALHITQLQPANNLTRGVQRLLDNGWMALDTITATKEVIAPLIGGFLGMILFPAFILQVLRIAFPRTVVDTNIMFMNIYPAIFLFAALVRSTYALYSILSTWSQTIRDKEFLIELRLKNHEPEIAPPFPPPPPPTATTTAYEGVPEAMRLHQIEEHEVRLVQQADLHHQAGKGVVVQPEVVEGGQSDRRDSSGPFMAEKNDDTGAQPVGQANGLHTIDHP